MPSADPFKIISSTIVSDVADGATFTASYPAGTGIGTFAGGVNHQLVVGQKTLFAPDDFGLDLTNATTITITNRSGTIWKAGSAFFLQLEVVGAPFTDPITGISPNRTLTLTPVQVAIGSPIAANASGFFASQSLTALGVASVNGTAAAAIAAAALVGVCDQPRNVVAAWTGTSVITITGTDEYGKAMTESSASGTSLTGKKAFKTVTNISVSADVTLLTVGTGNALGLPVFLPAALATSGNIIKELIAATLGGPFIAAAAGTAVAGLTNTTGGSTATTADVRGTYTPASAPDGVKSYQLALLLTDPGYLGCPQA